MAVSPRRRSSRSEHILVNFRENRLLSILHQLGTLVLPICTLISLSGC